MGHILGSAPSEAAAVDSYWDGDGWNPDINDADYMEDGIPIETKRGSLGDFQQRYTDRSIRLVAATQTITAAP